MQMTARNRLEFEPQLVARITEPGRPRRRVRSTLVIAGIVVLAIALTGGISARSTLLAIDRAALEHAGAALLNGLQTGDLQAALSVCAEDDAAGRILEGEERQVFLPGVNGATAVRRRPEERLQQLSSIREELARQGVEWSAVVPVAVGGVRACVRDPAVMSRPADTFIGNVYFASDGDLYAIEFTAWQCGHSYVIINIWQWTPVDGGPEQALAHSEQCFSRFEGELGSGKQNTEIAHARHVFIQF